MRTINKKSLWTRYKLYAYLGIAVGIIGFASVSAAINSNKDKVTQDGEVKIISEEIDANEEITPVDSTTSKNIEEVTDETENNVNDTQKTESTTKNTVPTTSNTTTKKQTATAQVQAAPKELVFMLPVDGNITREYAKDNLVYSPTLREWITHAAIDITAAQGTPVKASEEGKIKSIKNDPRYGLTVVIEHENNIKTIYSNLAETQGIKVNDSVKKGQVIGTVGKTASFEIEDNPHLHFELWKDDKVEDPLKWIK